MAYNDICSRGVTPVLCGGTGLYIEAVLKGYALSPVPQNPELRQSLEGKTLPELTVLLEDLKKKAGSVMHNVTDVDSCQRAIRAIEIETYNLEHATELRTMPPIDSVIVGLSVDRDYRRKKSATVWPVALTEAWSTRYADCCKGAFRPKTSHTTVWNINTSPSMRSAN